MIPSRILIVVAIKAPVPNPFAHPLPTTLRPMIRIDDIKPGLSLTRLEFASAVSSRCTFLHNPAASETLMHEAQFGGLCREMQQREVLLSSFVIKNNRGRSVPLRSPAPCSTVA